MGKLQERTAGQQEAWQSMSQGRSWQVAPDDAGVGGGWCSLWLVGESESDKGPQSGSSRGWPDRFFSERFQIVQLLNSKRSEHF